MDALPGWTDFFVAAAGASAALAGLAIVAISVNIGRILAYENLPSRAAAAIGTFVLALTASLAGLAPQPPAALSAELLLASALAWLLHLKAARASFRAVRTYQRPRYQAWLLLARGQCQVLPFAAAGLAVLAAPTAVGYLLLAGILASFALSVYETWILLVEILR